MAWEGNEKKEGWKIREDEGILGIKEKYFLNTVKIYFLI
jgi:hypothetical protein